jgi:hypothetical protein
MGYNQDEARLETTGWTSSTKAAQHAGKAVVRMNTLPLQRIRETLDEWREYEGVQGKCRKLFLLLPDSGCTRISQGV